MEKIVGIVVILLTSVLLTLIGKKMFQMFQLSSYRARGVFNWLKITKFDYIARYFALAFLSFIAMFVYVACFYKYLYVRYLGMLAFAGLCVLFLILTGREKAKVPLKYTARMIRFHAVTFVIHFGLSLLTLYISSFFTAAYSLLGVLPFLVPLTVTAAHYIVLPLETLNNYGYKVRAKNKLKTLPHVIRIGITGSYGKTTAKFVLAQMLKKKYRVCYSRASYNTPMGISKVVNNDMPYDTQVFIAEMGARFKGDIKELADIVEPNYGIITAIGNQHLETFGSQQNIIDTKYELIENLSPQGMALFNGDSAPNVELYEKTENCEKLITGKEGTPHASAYYSDVVQREEGVAFTLYLAGAKYEIKTALLGRHVPSVITQCAVLAFNLGVTPSEIIEVCSALEPVPHRLELIKQGDMVIIDDAYNANVEGAENALETLNNFAGRTRVVITPGLVELGKEEKQANKELGEKVGRSCDLAIFVGERGAQLKEGALAAGMAEEKIIEVQSISEAVSKLREVQGKTAVLFENDLPDNY